MNAEPYRYERCHCGWCLPYVKLGKLVIERRAQPGTGQSLEAEIHVTCPSCGCIFIFDRTATCVKSELVHDKGIGQA